MRAFAGGKLGMAALAATLALGCTLAVPTGGTPGTTGASNAKASGRPAAGTNAGAGGATPGGGVRNTPAGDGATPAPPGPGGVAEPRPLGSGPAGLPSTTPPQPLGPGPAPLPSGGGLGPLGGGGSSLLSNNGAGVLSNNGGGLMPLGGVGSQLGGQVDFSESAAGITLGRGSGLVGTVASLPAAGEGIHVFAAKGSVVLDVAGSDVVIPVAADGAFHYDGVELTRAIRLVVPLGPDRGELAALVAPPGRQPIRIDLASTIFTCYVRDHYVGALADPSGLVTLAAGDTGLVPAIGAALAAAPRPAGVSLGEIDTLFAEWRATRPDFAAALAAFEAHMAAGREQALGYGGPATGLPALDVRAMALDARGRLHFDDAAKTAVVRLDPDGKARYAGAMPGLSVEALALDDTGRLYAVRAAGSNRTLHRLEPDGTLTKLAVYDLGAPDTPGEGMVQALAVGPGATLRAMSQATGAPAPVLWTWAIGADGALQPPQRTTPFRAGEPNSLDGRGTIQADSTGVFLQKPGQALQRIAQDPHLEPTDTRAWPFAIDAAGVAYVAAHGQVWRIQDGQSTAIAGTYLPPGGPDDGVSASP